MARPDGPGSCPDGPNPSVSVHSDCDPSRSPTETGADLNYVLHGWRDRLVPRDEWGTSDQYTTLHWRFTDHRDGEIATYKVAGLWVWVGDYDGDCSEWRIRKGKGGPILAEGNRYDGNHFFACLHDAEAALRRIIVDRVLELRDAAQGAEAEGRNAGGGSVHEGPVAEGDAPSSEPTRQVLTAVEETK